MPGGWWALVPKDPESHSERIRRDQSDMDGSFTLGGILPGRTSLIAGEDGGDFPWMPERGVGTVPATRAEPYDRGIDERSGTPA